MLDKWARTYTKSRFDHCPAGVIIWSSIFSGILWILALGFALYFEHLFDLVFTSKFYQKFPKIPGASRRGGFIFIENLQNFGRGFLIEEVCFNTPVLNSRDFFESNWNKNWSWGRLIFTGVHLPPLAWRDLGPVFDPVPGLALMGETGLVEEVIPGILFPDAPLPAVPVLIPMPGRLVFGPPG